MASDPSTSEPVVDAVSRGGLRSQVTNRLLTGIFVGRYRSGQRLVVQHLADQYRVSPTPVRESLVELSGLGLVDLLPNRGAVVRRFGPTEVREISQIRRVLESEAARCVAAAPPMAALQTLEHELTRLQDTPIGPEWDADVRAADTSLHMLIAESCGSTRLTAEIQRYLTMFRMLRDVSHQRDAVSNYAHSNDLPEHLAVVRSLLGSDADGASRAMAAHIDSAAANLGEVLFADSHPPGVSRIVNSPPLVNDPELDGVLLPLQLDPDPEVI
jgi:DNA-binding GntR family transcriptional regulator